MYYVRQYEADQFCQALGRLDGRRYRLPTEAEWEYVCRAGTKTAYYNGDSEPALAEVAWFRDNSGGKTQPVGRKKPNAWGLYDMIGNVYQWCSDGYEQYPLGAATDPSGNVHSSFGGVIRGGSWGSYPSDCRSAHRDKYTAARGANFIGFRICVDSN
jgi:formylglycine-generating enzyme required for sulfatase activity